MDYQPWIEKYRPKQFEDIVLSKHNKILLDNIVKSDHFPQFIVLWTPRNW